MIEQRQLFLSE
jgi:hypothetical protein